ncbi:MAG: FxsA family protein [Alphaproteobacteria bacterium]
MPFLILALFIGVPIAEIALFIEVGERIGLGWTLIAILATAVAGTWLVRQQGLAVLNRVRSEMDQNRMPVGEVLSGVCILVAGALLLTPGFLTDTLGFILLIPPFRAALGRGVVEALRRSGRFHVHTTGSGGGPGHGPHERGPGGRGPGGRGPVIDGEFEDVTPDREGPSTGDTGPDGPTDRRLR